MFDTVFKGQKLSFLYQERLSFVKINGIVFLLIFYTFYDTIFTPIYSQYVSTVRLLLSLANKDDKKILSILLLNLRILP
jgi:hypothetical protein